MPNWKKLIASGSDASLNSLNVKGTIAAASFNGNFAGTVGNNLISANQLNVTGNGTTSQYLRSDGDGTFTWATPPNTTYSVGNGGLTEINFTSALNTKLAGITTGANNYSLPEATATTRGGIELFSNTDNPTAANAVSSTAGRTYGIQLNSAGQAVVNVPWVDTNTNTTYTAGTGLTLSGTTFSNAAPDQTVTLTGAGATTISGTYPNFTISSTDTNTNTNYFLDGITKSGNTLTFSVSGTTNRTYTFGSNAFTSYSNHVGLYDSVGSADAVNLRIDEEVLPAIPTNNNQLTNGAGYITSYVNTTYGAGNGISLSGTTFSVAAGGGLTQTSTGLAHTDTSSQSSVNNSGNTVIQDVTLDTYGHVTGLASATITLSSLGFTGATNANYITNNNQLTNGAGYLTSTNDRVYLTDSRGAVRLPSFYDDRYAQWDFQSSADTEAGGDGWHAIQTISKWSSFNDSHRQEQLIFTGDNLKRRTAVSDEAWGELKTVWDSGNLNPVVSATVSNDTTTFTKADGSTFALTTSDANSNTVTSIRRDNTGTYRTGNINLVGGSNVTITETSAGVFSFASTDTNTNTTYSAGTGLTLSGTTFSLTTPITNNNQLTNGAGYQTAAQVNTAIQGVVDSAPDALNTLNELAAALGDDANFAGTVTTALAGKLSTTGKAADSNLLDGLDLHTGRNNEVNKVVRTNASGYAEFGWINTTSGATTSTITDFFVNTGDGYIRKSTPAHVKSQLGLGSAAYVNTSTFDAAGTGAAEANAVNDRIDSEVLPAIPTNNNQLTNGAGYITSYVNTTYSAGTGLTLVGTQFRNTAPDQTVTLTGAGATTISGTYPNFTITSTDTDTNTNTVTSIRRDNTGTYRTGNINLVGGSNVTITETSAGVFSFASTDTNTNTNYFLNGITKSGNTLTFSVSGTTNQTYTFGSNAFTSYSNHVGLYDSVGSADAVNSRIDSEVLPAIPTNNNQLTNGAGYITSYVNTQRSDEEIRDVAAAQWVNGTNTTVVKDDTNNTIKINSTNTNTTYSAGTGLTLSGTTFSLTNTYDNYVKWQVSDGITNTNIASGDKVTFIGGGATNINYDEGSKTFTITSTDTNTDTNTTYTAGGGLTLSGTTFSHTDTSSQGSVNNSGRTYIQDITLDTYGHITGITSATETVVNTDTDTITTIAAKGFLPASGNFTFVGGGATTIIQEGEYITITSTDTNTDTNTTYTADGNYGLTLSGTTFRLEDDRRRNSTGVDIYSGNTHDFTWYDADVGIRWYTAGAEEMRLQNDGTLHVDGDVVAYSTTVPSDERLKDNVTTIQNPLDKIKALRGVEYDWNNGNRKGKHDLGLIAQEVEAVIPEIVYEHTLPMMDDSDTLYKTVDYEKMVAVLIEGMKEQQTQIESLKSEIETIKGKL